MLREKKKKSKKFRVSESRTACFVWGSEVFIKSSYKDNKTLGTVLPILFLNYTEPTTSHDTISRLQSVWLPYFHHNHSSYFQSIRSPSSSIPHPVVALITSALQSPTLIFTYNRIDSCQHSIFCSAPH